MPPSGSLQARIAAFEHLSSNPKLTGGFRAVPSPPQAQRQQLSKVVPEPHLLDGDPTSPTSDSLLSIPALKPSYNPPRSSSPPILGRKSSLIDFSELSASPRHKNESPLPTDETGSSNSSASYLDSLRKPQLLPPRTNPRIPPLPPRKPSRNSLRESPPSKVLAPGLPTRSSPISIASSRLAHSETPLDLPVSTHHASNSSDGSSRHLPASSISSFQSVSLSSGGIDTPEDSLDGSYEAVSSTAATSPITESQTFPTSVLRAQKSNISLRKSSSNEPALSESSSVSTRRRPPPPPPPLKKPQFSNPSANPSLFRPVPIPMNMRKRYNIVFDRHVVLSQKGHSTSGWRGPSLDLLTGIDVDDLNELQINARLDGYLVKAIWKSSKLSNSVLREIWNECDPNRTGVLDRDAFALGMWRIDEALRVRQQSGSLKKPSFPQSANASLPSLPNRSVNVLYTPRVPYTTRKTP